MQLLQRQLQAQEQSLDSTRSAHQAGRATDLELDLAELQVQQARTDRQQAERALPRALRSLWNTAGGPSAQAQQVCPLMEVADGGRSLDLEQAASLQIAVRSEELDRIDRTGSRLSFLPTLTALGGLSWSGSGDAQDSAIDDFAFNYWYVGGSLSWTLFSGLSRYHDNRSATWTVQQGELEAAQELRDLQQADAERAAELQDLAEDLQLLERQLALQRRQLAATRAAWQEEGRVPLDLVLSQEQAVTQLEQQLLSTRQRQLLTMARRWIDAGHTGAFLAALTSSDRAQAAAGACTELRP